MIVEPTDVTVLVNELCEQSLVYVWWDELVQEIKLRAIRPQDSETTITGDNAIIQDTLSRSDGQNERLSRVVIYFDRASPLSRLDDPASFKQIQTGIYADAEGVDQYNESRIRRVVSRWFD